jgi:hypothetical protein
MFYCINLRADGIAKISLAAVQALQFRRTFDGVKQGGRLTSVIYMKANPETRSLVLLFLLI